MPGRDQLDPVEMRQDGRRFVTRTDAQRRCAVGLREIPLRDDARIEVGAQTRSPRNSQMRPLAGIPRIAVAPRRLIRAAESGQLRAPTRPEAGTMRAITWPRLVTATSCPRDTRSSTAARLCCTSRTDAVVIMLVGRYVLHARVPSSQRGVGISRTAAGDAT